ncbi:MAG: hypothetical protein IJM90_05035 [Firmicutes bacterium]|nr:hypothetical protein [Bacillota bacterium]
MREKRILYLEDEWLDVCIFTRLVAEIFEEDAPAADKVEVFQYLAQHNIDWVDNAPEALHKTKTEAYDLYLIDIMIYHSAEGGYAVLNELKEDPARRVWCLSSLGFLSAAIKAEYSIDRFFTKKELTAFKQELGTFLGRYRAQPPRSPIHLCWDQNRIGAERIIWVTIDDKGINLKVFSDSEIMDDPDCQHLIPRYHEAFKSIQKDILTLAESGRLFEIDRKVYINPWMMEDISINDDNGVEVIMRQTVRSFHASRRRASLLKKKYINNQ